MYIDESVGVSNGDEILFITRRDSVYRRKAQYDVERAKREKFICSSQWKACNKMIQSHLGFKKSNDVGRVRPRAHDFYWRHATGGLDGELSW